MTPDPNIFRNPVDVTRDAADAAATKLQKHFKNNYSLVRRLFPTYILLTYILIIFISYDSFKSSDLQQTTTKKKTIDAPPKGSTKVSRKVKKPKHKQTIKTPVEPAQRKVRKDKVAGPPFVCQRCNASYSQRKTLWQHVKSGKCQGVPRPEKPKHKVIKGRYYCAHPTCLPPAGEFGDQVGPVRQVFRLLLLICKVKEERR